MSNCYEPRGNDALSVQPNRRLLKMPDIDPHVRSPRLRKLGSPVRADRRPPNLLRWTHRRPDGRIVSPCIGLSCGPFLARP